MLTCVIACYTLHSINGFGSLCLQVDKPAFPEDVSGERVRLVVVHTICRSTDQPKQQGRWSLPTELDKEWVSLSVPGGAICRLCQGTCLLLGRTILWLAQVLYTAKPYHKVLGRTNDAIGEYPEHWTWTVAWMNRGNCIDLFYPRQVSVQIHHSNHFNFKRSLYSTCNCIGTLINWINMFQQIHSNY